MRKLWKEFKEDFKSDEMLRAALYLAGVTYILGACFGAALMGA